MSRQRLVEDDKPWYRQFWPWFLIALPGSVVIAGFTTLYIAIENRHSLVDDQYYKEGMGINRRLEQDQMAADLNMQARVEFDWDSSQVMVTLSGDALPGSLNLKLMHPVRDSFDLSIPLRREGEQFVGQLGDKLQHSYYLRLTPGDDRWRLNGEVDFSYGNRVLLDSK